MRERFDETLGAPRPQAARGLGSGLAPTTREPSRTSPPSSSRSRAGALPDGWDADLPDFPADAKGIATREASGKVLNAIAPERCRG